MASETGELELCAATGRRGLTVSFRVPMGLNKPQGAA